MTAVDAGTALESQQDALRRRLERDVEGEVAFDDYSRHLFSRDASMYTMLPLGVVYPRSADDVAAAVTAAAELGVPITPRGAGTSLAGQTVGPGLVLDTSRHLDRIHELDPSSRTARRRRRRRAGPAQPGRRPARAAVRPRHLDQQPRHDRRDDRQQLRRQRQPALRHDHRPRTRARGRALRRVDRPAGAGRRGRAGPAGAGRHARGPDLPRAARDHGAARPLDRRGLPAVLAAGLRLPAGPAGRPGHPVRPREVRRGLGGHARRDHPRRGGPGAQAAAHGLRRRPLRLDPGRDRRDHRRAVAGPGAGRADGQDDPRPVPQQDRVRRPRPEPRGRPGRRCCSSPSPATTSTRSPTGSTS